MKERPNIILIITDQQRYDTISALGFDHCITPNLDKLVADGTTFEQCHVTAASCAPARASLFTGYYPHSTGILKNADDWTRSWVEVLANGGYHCTNIGKMHTWPFTTPCGFNERHVVENKDRFLEGAEFTDEWESYMQNEGIEKQRRELYRKRDDYKQSLGAFAWEQAEDSHSDFFTGNKAIEWLNNYRNDQPFFLEIGFPGPHPPYDPVPSYLELYNGIDIPIAKVLESDLEGQPNALKALRQHNVDVDHDSIVHQLDPSDEARLRQRKHYLANVTMIDHALGKITKCLEKNNLSKNTVVIFTSDHGDCLTDHGHSQKWTMFEQITRVPLIFSGPSIKQNTRVSELVQWMDIGPTILDLAGCESPKMEAISMLPALQGGHWQGRDYLFCEQVGDMVLTEVEFMSMIRSKKWKLIHYLDSEEGQLYNLTDDPAENENLWNHEMHQSQKELLLSELLNWRVESQLYHPNCWIYEN
jgi:arylsulfatase